jgi:hypothetical protein
MLASSLPNLLQFLAASGQGRGTTSARLQKPGFVLVLPAHFSYLH